MVVNTVKLTPEMRDVVDSLMRSGHYPDAESVIAAALRMMAELRDDMGTPQDLEFLIQAGRDDITAGNYVDLHGEAEIRAFVEGIGAEVDARIPFGSRPR